MPQSSGTTGVMEVDVSVSGWPDQLARVKGQEPSDGCEELVSDLLAAWLSSPGTLSQSKLLKSTVEFGGFLFLCPS